MNTPRTTHIALLAAAISSLTLAGCVVVPPASQPYYGQQVMVAPPSPRVEVIGVAPYPGYIWIGGYWGWRGGRHDWVPGRWEAPRHGHRWVPHRWEKSGSHWREQGGRWERH